jgi:uncharacterized membrane protein YoaK (UPF0700 family)
MFRHTGKGRTYVHNLNLAAILSGVAGIVNITGLLSLATLTTNVTGHFAYFSDVLVLKNYSKALTFLAYIFSFLSGAFLSSFLLEWGSRRKLRTSYLLPVSIEIIILISVGSLGLSSWKDNLPVPDFLACLLLLTMGLQNALVTHVSQSVVRTTHLTGIFTDLGIELSQLFFYSEAQQRQQLYKGISLKLAIIACFFCGGVAGGYIYLMLGLTTLFLPVLLLAVALWYDHILFRHWRYFRKKLRE